MGIFSSKWEYQAYAASVSLFEEGDHPHTFQQIMLEGMRMDDTFGNILAFSYRTDMYARSKAMVKYATKPVDPYIRGLPTSDISTFIIEKEWINSAILREIKIPIEDFTWWTHGVFDIDFFTKKFIHDHYLDINYFPWPEGCLAPLLNPRFNDAEADWTVQGTVQFLPQYDGGLDYTARLTANDPKIYNNAIGNVVPGEVITLTAVCDRGGGTNVGSLNLTFYNSGGSEISTASTLKTTGAENEWELLTVTTAAPSGAVTVKAWAGAVVGSPCITSSLAHWWTMDETSGNRADSKGSVTLTDNNAVASSSSTKRYGRSALFASDYFTGSLAGSPIDNQGSFSGVVWVRCSPSRPSNSGRPFTIMKKGLHAAASSADESWVLTINQSSNWATLRVRGPVLNKTVSRAQTFAINTWYFVYFYYDSVLGEIGVSVNNGTITKDTFGGTDLMYTHNEFDMGRYSSVTTNYHGGYLDEVGLWNRKLDADEVTFLYMTGDGTAYSDLFWDCDGGPQIYWEGSPITSEITDIGVNNEVNIYFYEGSNGIPTYLAEPYDSTCGYYVDADTLGFVRVISDRYPAAGNNVSFSINEYVVKFEYVSGSTNVYLNTVLGRAGLWFDLFRCDIRIVQYGVGSNSATIDVTVGVWNGSGSPAAGTAGVVSGTEKTRRVTLSVTSLG